MVVSMRMQRRNVVRECGARGLRVTVVGTSAVRRPIHMPGMNQRKLQRGRMVCRSGCFVTKW